MDEILRERVAGQVKIVIREAREAYNASYRFALRVLEISEIKEGLKLYEEKYGETARKQE